MKKLFLIFFIPALFGYNAEGQTCKSIQLKKGAEMEFKTYNHKDKFLNSCKQKVTDLQTTSSGWVAQMNSQSFNDKDKLVSSQDFVVKCENDVILVDMKQMLNSEQMKSFQNTEMKVTGDQLDFPSNPQAGQQLKNGTISVTAASKGGPNLFSMNITVSNRKVEAIEQITTPAGTFQCVKISYDVESKMLFTTRSHTVQWFCPELGLSVRTEIHDKKGELQDYTVLNSITK